jgi:hypothetical protein
VAASKMSQAQSSNWKWLRTLRFIAKKIARTKRRVGNMAERMSCQPPLILRSNLRGFGGNPQFRLREDHCGTIPPAKRLRDAGRVVVRWCLLRAMFVHHAPQHVANESLIRRTHLVEQRHELLRFQRGRRYVPLENSPNGEPVRFFSRAGCSSQLIAAQLRRRPS